MVKDKTKIVKEDFWCYKDLSECTDSLLFDSDESIAEYTATDENDNTVNIWLAVKGEVNITRNDTGDNFYRRKDYDEELIADIKSGEIYSRGETYIEDKYEIVSNNWFEGIYTFTNAEGKYLYSDGEVYEDDFSKKTKDELKADLREWALVIFKDAYERGDLEMKEKPKGKVKAEKENE
jgi:hypothetical protein